jgi:hypothetical protein
MSELMAGTRSSAICVITIYGQREGYAPEIYAERRVES